MSKDERPVLYINIIVLDASEAVKATVTESINKNRPKMPEQIKKGVAQVASDLATPSRVAEKIGAKVCEKMTKKLKEKGITAEVEEVFQELNYLVLQMQVQHVDTVTVAAGFFEWIKLFFCLIGAYNQKSLELDYLPGVVQSKMELLMDELLAEKIAEKKVEARAKVLHESNQARYFYSTLKEVREATAAEKASKRSMANLKRKVSSEFSKIHIQKSTLMLPKLASVGRRESQRSHGQLEEEESINSVSEDTHIQETHAYEYTCTLRLPLLAS